MNVNYRQKLEKLGYKVTILKQHTLPIMVSHPQKEGGRFWTLAEAYHSLFKNGIIKNYDPP